MQIIPIQPVPSQTVNVQLGSQPATLNIYETVLGAVFVDIYVNGVLILGGAIANNATRIVRTAYLGFIGDLAFFDNQPSATNGPANPSYTGLGTRWPLYYLTPADLGGVG